MTRRGNREGTIHKRTDGRWAAAVTLPGGGRRYFYGRTRTEVAGKLGKAQQSLAEGLPLPSERLTVDAYLDRWLASVKATLRPNTYAGYESALRIHVRPTLGKTLLARVGPEDLATLYQSLLEGGLSPTTVRYVHRIVHRALRQGERWSLVQRNVAGLVDPPRLAQHEIAPLSPAEIRTLLTAARGDRFEALYVVAVTTGMRQAEMLGLRWADADLATEIVSVRQQAQRTAGAWVFTEPKTAKGRRSITLPSMAVEALRAHRSRQNEERLRLGPSWEDLDLVFPNEVGRPIERQNLTRRSFRPLLKRAKLRTIRFHDLRHSAATLLLSEGVHPKVVQERLGHATIGITLDVYSHVLPNLQAEAATKLDGFLNRPAVSS